jgi:hypothetical protein
MGATGRPARRLVFAQTQGAGAGAGALTDLCRPRDHPDAKLAQNLYDDFINFR